MGADTRAQTAVAAVSGGKRLICNFVDATAYGPTRTILLLSELLRTAIPLVHTLTPTEETALDELTTFPFGQPELDFTISATNDLADERRAAYQAVLDVLQALLRAQLDTRLDARGGIEPGPADRQPEAKQKTDQFNDRDV
jgi:hypothetical protein